ncbi:MAG: hypothetical protein ACOYJW_06225 [Candidatus Omnitrophota bacterium]
MKINYALRVAVASMFIIQQLFSVPASGLAAHVPADDQPVKTYQSEVGFDQSTGQDANASSPKATTTDFLSGETGVLTRTQGDSSKAELESYLQSVADTGREYLEAIRDDFEQIAGVSGMVSRDELERLISDMGLNEAEASRLRNLHTYCRLNSTSASSILSGDYGLMHREFPEFFNAEGNPTEALNKFREWATSERLPLTSPVMVFMPPTGSSIGELPIEILRKLADAGRAALGDDPKAYYARAQAEIEQNVPKIVQAMEKIKKEIVELKKRVPLAVQSFVKELQKQIGDGFRVEVRKETNGTYRVNISALKVISKPPLKGTLTAMIVRLDGTGKVLGVTANYSGISVDTKLLFEAMGVCPEGQKCAVVRDVEKLSRMAKITVTKVVSGEIYFTRDGVDYKTSRDSKGRVIVKQLSPSAAVQSFVKELQKQIGDGFRVDVQMEPNGTYRVNISALKVISKPPLKGTLTAMIVRLDGTGKVLGVTANYSGISVDTKLLFEAMGVCPEGQKCAVVRDVEKLSRMAKITVTKVVSGEIYFTRDGVDYKTSRDSKGRVIVKRQSDL